MSCPHPRCSKSSPFLLSSHWRAWAQLPWRLHYTQGFIFITLACPGPDLCHHLGEKISCPRTCLECGLDGDQYYVVWDAVGSRCLAKEIHTSPRVKSGKNRPLVGGIQLHRDNIQSIPRGDTGPTEQALPANHRRLAVAKKQEEAADCRDEHGATCGDKTKVNRNVKPASWSLFPHRLSWRNLLLELLGPSSTWKEHKCEEQTHTYFKYNYIYLGKWMLIYAHGKSGYTFIYTSKLKILKFSFF